MVHKKTKFPLHEEREELLSKQERRKLFTAFWKAETKGKSSISIAGSKYKINKIS
jgi:hypothetical protein